ncbi:hypothetical protein JCM8097_002476 [Rhodosporidiobolus ruineniae]
MLSRLPVELLRLIIREAAPLEYRSSTYKDRRLTLMSLCLVDKRTRAVAQPVLPELLKIDLYPADASNAFALSPFQPVAPEAWARVAPSIAMVVLSNPHSIYGKLPQAVLSLPALRSITFDGVRFRIAHLAALPNLVSLVVADCLISADPPPSPFQALLQLSLNETYIVGEAEQAELLLSPGTFPLLRDLAVASLNIVDETYSQLPAALQPSRLHLHSTSSSRLYTLTLPAPLLRLPYSASTSLVETRDRLVQQCEDWGTTVLWGEDQLEAHSLIPQSFVEYRRGVKARETREPDVVGE